ncbi:hypothetical protein PHLGIDRAFT_76637 [Phlebiopsis gigantea 11061_1 CR5-6]|uniref:Uncharacterized protein n=1 Tax=Phlebiopsis gigantea (strain 11061_1 CR5-6) TaxID=745531 RepID=A0A0C3S2V6_PHLG1|nr:hypothetical protein PHLGIDRAFT_76637 [Phlebiopsis gigantea 11061_1 CR5-6]
MADSPVFEHAYYIGSYISGILYGVDLVLYFLAVRQLMRRRVARKSYLFYLLFSTALTLLVTVDISVNAVWGEIMWINARGQPGGVPAFVDTQLSSWYQALGSSSAVGLTLLSDALLIHRLFVIYKGSVYIIVFPVLVYIAAAALAILELVTSFTPGGFFFGTSSVNFGVPYYSMTIGLNVLVTSLICFQLLSLSHQVREVLGEQNARLYTGAIAILVESAAPYTLIGIVFLIPYARSSPVGAAVGQIWAKFTCLAPQAIIFRIVSDQAWCRDTMTQFRTADAARRACRRQESSAVELTTHVRHDLDADSCAGLSSYDVKRGTKFSTSTSGCSASDIV